MGIFSKKISAALWIYLKKPLPPVAEGSVIPKPLSSETELAYQFD